MIRLGAIAMAALLLIHDATAARAGQAHVQAGGEEGQALLFTHRGVCFGVTPQHVMDAGFDFAALTRRAATLHTAQATTLRRFGFDLALITVSGSLADACGAPFARVEDVGAAIDGARGNARVMRMFGNGDGVFLPVQIVASDTTHILFEPVGDWSVGGGDSGGTLGVGDTVIGLVLEAGGPNAPARALRWDFASQLIAWELDRTGGAPPGGPVATAPAAAPIVVEAPNSHPVAADTTPANLGGDTEMGAGWQARAIDWPVDLVISFDDGEIKHIAGITLAGIAGQPDLLPKDVEIQRTISASGNANWSSYATTVLDPGEARTLTFPSELRARRLRLRIHSVWGEGDVVGLSRLAIVLAE